MNDTLQKLISENKIPQAIGELRQMSKYDRDLHTEVIQISARYEEYLRQKRLGMSDDAAANIELSRIRAALVDVGERAEASNESNSIFKNIIKTNQAKNWLPVIALLSILGISYLIYGFLNRRHEDEKASTTPITLQQLPTDEPNTFKIAFYKNEEEAHPDIEKDLMKSKKVKLYAIRGSRLFKEEDGLFYLKRYKKGKIEPLQVCQVLLLDFSPVTQEQYNKIQENVNLKWTTREEDTKTQQNTVKIINSLKSDYNIEAKLYQQSDFQYFKMFIFDDYCYFTIYHKVGNAKEHQEYRLIKAKYGDPMYESLESIFDANWKKAKEANSI
jgi:hypothetical protein